MDKKTTKSSNPNYFLRMNWPFCLLLLIASVWWIYFRLRTGLTWEDAYITFRYSTNLASGNGFVFNPGERVLGTTTPLFALLLALAGKLFGISLIPSIGAALSVFCGLAAGAFIYALCRHVESARPVALIATALYLSNGLILRVSVGGMETSLVLLLMAASAYGIVSARFPLTFWACAFLVITRLDGIFWGVACCLAIFHSRQTVRFRDWFIPFALIILPWFLFAFFYFGSIVPNTVYAKQVIGIAGDRHTHSLSDAIHFCTWFIGALGYGTTSLQGLWLVLLVLGVFVGQLPMKRKLLARTLVGFLLLYAAFLFWGKAPYQPRYLAPALWAFSLFIAFGLKEVADLWHRQDISWSKHLRFGFVCTILVLYALIQNRNSLAPNRQYEENEWQTRRVLGLWLQQHTPLDSSVAMEAIGYQGYYSQREIVDMAGLVSPRVIQLRQESSSNAETFYKLISQIHPDYLVLRSFEADRNLHFHGGPLFENAQQKRYFQLHYREVKRFVAPHPKLWKTLSPLTLFERVKEPETIN